MYGVSKINIEPSLMMISVQDVEFKGNSLARSVRFLNGITLYEGDAIGKVNEDVLRRI